MAPFVLNAIEEKSEYPGDLIINHLSSILPPTTSFLLLYKNLNQYDNTLKQTSKTILHLHFSTRNGVEILTSFLKFRKNIITLVSAESEKILEEVKEQFQREDVIGYSYAHVESVSSNDADWIRDMRIVLIAAQKAYVLNAPLGVLNLERRLWMLRTSDIHVLMTT